MTLTEQIERAIREAMLARETTRLEALRAVKAAILLERTSGASHEVSDADVIRIMTKLVKQRRESADLYKSAGRNDLADKELTEAGFIEAYLPRQMSPEELETALIEIIARIGAKAPSDMGRVMGVASKELAGKADGRSIAETVKRLLAR